MRTTRRGVNFGAETVMAAASSGVEVVVEDRDGSGKESHERKQGVLVGELPDRFSLETPQEGTKEHMNVVEVSPSFPKILPSSLACL